MVQLRDRPLQVRSTRGAFRALPAMPIEVLYLPLSLVVSLEKQDDEIIFRFRAAEERTSRDGSNLDAYSLREAFLEARTPGEAFELLSVSGFFRYGNDENETLSDGMRFTLTWSDFQRWQKLIRFILAEGFLDRIAKANGSSLDIPEDLRSVTSGLSVRELLWLGGTPGGITIDPENAPGHSGMRSKLTARIYVSTALEAILATIYIDQLNGLDYRLCALSDCSTLYEVSSKHERQYCSQACAHKGSVRRRRAEAAKLRARKKKPMKGNGA